MVQTGHNLMPNGNILIFERGNDTSPPMSRGTCPAGMRGCLEVSPSLVDYPTGKAATYWIKNPETGARMGGVNWGHGPCVEAMADDLLTEKWDHEGTEAEYMAAFKAAGRAGKRFVGRYYPDGGRSGKCRWND